jgi:hypothetical protein
VRASFGLGSKGVAAWCDADICRVNANGSFPQVRAETGQTENGPERDVQFISAERPPLAREQAITAITDDASDLSVVCWTEEGKQAADHLAGASASVSLFKALRNTESCYRYGRQGRTRGARRSEPARSAVRQTKPQALQDHLPATRFGAPRTLSTTEHRRPANAYLLLPLVETLARDAECTGFAEAPNLEMVEP